MRKSAPSILLLLLLSTVAVMLDFSPDAASPYQQSVRYSTPMLRLAYAKPPANLPTKLSVKPTAKLPTSRSSTRGIESTSVKYAMYEPPRGVYLGAALDFSHLPGKGSKMGEMADVMGAWEGQTWREHAIYMQFLQFPHDDGSFPTWDSDPQGWATAADFSNAAAALKAAPLLTLEPMRPELFTQKWEPGAVAYEATKNFALAAGQWGKPLFIRFAHEMNGSWYPWAEWRDKNRNRRRDPGEDTGFTAADYRAAFRNVASMFRRYAPNAALVWCPNAGLLSGGQRDVFLPFYPGDDVVDWVGLDIYERGWKMPQPGARLWAGQFAYNLTHDAADDPATKDKNESINFYETFAVGKKKPLMICETAATLSFRSDLNLEERAALNHQWKAGYWNSHEYGWMQAVYGTSAYRRQPLLQPLDKTFPRLKAIIWFQVAKRETVSAEKPTADGVGEIVWFENAWADYRVGGGAEEGDSQPYGEKELQMYRELIANDYFLSNIVP